MTDRFYRFRSINNLLGTQEELQRQEIYFASPSELNDPMEGFKDIFWRGDEVVWTNLFRHYLQSLQSAFALVCLVGEEDPIEWETAPIVDLRSPAHRSVEESLIHRKICDRFFNEQIRSWIQSFSNRELPMRRDEVMVYFKWIHAFGMDAVMNVMEEHGIQVRKPDAQKTVFDHAGNLANLARLPDLLAAITIDKDDTSGAISALFQAWRHVDSQMNLLHAHSNESILHRKNWYFFCFRFPESYVNNLEKLIYPDWYTACFMSDCTNASLWGYYGDNHKGACLVFRSEPVSGKPAIALNRINGWSSHTGPSVGSVQHPFVKVGYEPTYPSIDFFRSLGRMSVTTLNKEWYEDKDGNRSNCADDIFSDQDAWRDRYWAGFERSFAIKMKDWEHEKEFRLVLSGAHTDFSEKASRKATYDFHSLEGIIFGIKTSLEDKLKIIKIIEEKCKAENRTDFKFYQATYSPGDGKITHDELRLFQFKPDSQ